MKSEAEVRKALEAFAWYLNSPRILRQDILTRNNLGGVLACLEWLLGKPEGAPLVEGTLEDIAEMRRRDEPCAS